MADDRTVTTSDPPAALPEALVLILSSERAPIQTASLPARGVISIGRSGECAIVVDDASLSRRHATLRIPELTVIDHGSRNGTWLGATRVPDEAEVAVTVGQPFRLGHVTAVIVRVGAIDRGRELVGDGTNPVGMDAVHAYADRVARSGASVLIQGETGVGKELLAERIHRASPRAAAPLVKINCAALAPSLFESQMFGHERGAFTGAVDAQLGMIEAADGGTLFLDEVADLPLELQAKLLRVLEDRVVVRVGAVKGRTVDVRFVSATNEPLVRRVDAGRFRGDLYYRLATFTIDVPPLRERTGELASLIERFAAQIAETTGVRPPPPSPAALERLRAHAWPGNIRQLRNVIERAAVLCDGPAIEPAHLQLDDRPSAPAPPPDGPLDPDVPEHLTIALARCGGNQTRAARLLGISRNTLLARLDQFGLPRPRKT